MAGRLRLRVVAVAVLGVLSIFILLHRSTLSSPHNHQITHLKLNPSDNSPLGLHHNPTRSNGLPPAAPERAEPSGTLSAKANPRASRISVEFGAGARRNRPGEKRPQGLDGPRIPCLPRPTNGTHPEFTCEAARDPVMASLQQFVEAKNGLSRRAVVEGFTVVISTFARDEGARELAEYYSTCQYVKGIDIIFHNPKRQPPPKLRNLQRKLKKGVDYRLLHAATNRISNRFNTSGVATEAIFSVDDDRKIPCELVTEAFLLWLHMGNLSMVLPVYDAARWIDLDYWKRPGEPFGPFYDWKSPYGTGKYNTGFVTQGGFLSKAFHDAYFEPRFQSMRRSVDGLLTGEDMLMSFVHAESGGPVVAITRLYDRAVMLHESKQTMALAGRSSNRRPLLLNAMRSMAPANGCPTCGWWDFHQQAPAAPSPHEVSKKLGKIKPPPGFHPPKPVSDDVRCRELAVVYKIVHGKTFGTAPLRVKKEWERRKCGTHVKNSVK